MKEKSTELVRLKKVLLSDELQLPSGLNKVLKSDIIGILNSYFDVDEENVTIEIAVEKDGSYGITVTAVSNGIKKVKIL